VTKPITQRINEEPALLFDGGNGSRLIQMGLPTGKAPEEWLLTNPDRIKQVHEEYIQAGSEVITTCSFGGNRYRLKKAGLVDRIEDVNRIAVQLAKETAKGQVYIAGGMGPTGEFFQPHGTLTNDEAREVFEEQARILAGEAIDFFLLETYYDLKEAQICLKACQNMASQIPIGITLTFNYTPKGFFTVMGNPAADALQKLSEAGAFLVGSNCTLDVKGMINLTKALTAELKLPLLFQPNAGTPVITPEGILYPQSPEEFALFTEEALKLHARAIGGCCGTNSDHIKAMRNAIDSKFTKE
jgi:5-methyltetrahydrofolate--homocysteine methyltransferase